MAVPVNYDEEAEGILVRGEPNYFYLDKTYVEDIKKIEGVRTVTPEFFLTSTSESCCDVKVQFIGFDPESDFSIQPWIREKFEADLEDGALLIGSDIQFEDEDKSLKFFDQEFQVAARLQKTGTGLDQSIYADMNTIKTLFEAARKKGFSFTENIDPEKSVSAILIDTEEGYDPDTVRHNIRSRINGVQVIKSGNMITDIAKNLGQFVWVLYLLVALLIVLSFMTMATIFSVSINERKKEFATIRVLGGTSSYIAQIICREAGVIGIGGSLCGLLLASLIIFPFSYSISQSWDLPFIQPGPLEILGLALASLLVSFLVCTITSIISIVKVNKIKIYESLRDNR
ncbi:MAG: ABC transporter permease [Eubacterium sp.]|nr:ABC transporter permease [Eubacterium sp.]